jgi:hypothetical protein
MPVERGPFPGLELLVDVTPERVDIRRAAAVRHAPRTRLRAPELTRTFRDPERRGHAEIVLAVLRPDGKIADSFGWPAVETIYHDVLDAAGEVSGSPVAQTDFAARLRVPLGHDVRYLCFYRAETIAGLTEEPQYRILGVYDLRPGDPGPLPPWPVPGNPPVLPIPPVPIPLFRPFPAWMIDLVSGRRNTTFRAYGNYVKDIRTLIDSGRGMSAFDVVIMAEGFTEADLPLFDHYAALLAHGLVLTPPFTTHLDRINVYAVRTVSVEAGVTQPPVTKDTFFSAQGCFGRPAPTFFGTQQTALVHETASSAVPPPRTVDATIIIVNYPHQGGGSAFPSQRLVFVPLIQDPDKFLNTAVHEMAHVIHDICEEYISCTTPGTTNAGLNQARAAELNPNTVWWKSLALAGELGQNGTFKVVHRIGDPMTGKPDFQPDLALPNATMLGAFWGCQDADNVPPGPALTYTCQGQGAGQGPGCQPYDDPHGAAYFRPMAECKMRRLRYKFCRVCGHLISEAILDAAP